MSEVPEHTPLIPVSNADTIEAIENVITLTETLLAPLAMVVPPLATLQTIVSNVGGIVKLFSAGTVPNPVLEKLAELEQKIEKLGRKMENQFNDMKDFIAEVNFVSHVNVPTESLWQYLQDCLKHPQRESLDNFRKEYEKRTPLRFARAKPNERNPLKMAMLSDPLRKKSTFESWHRKFDALLGRCIYLELFASGLIKDKKSDYLFDSRLLIKEAAKFHKNMDSWEDDYKKDPAYFDGMKDYLETFLVENPSLSSNGLADKLQQYLNTELLTNDALYILVCNAPVNSALYASYAPDKTKRQLVELRNKVGHNITVFRSTTGNSVEQLKYDEMLRKTMIYLKNKLVMPREMDVRTRNVFNAFYPNDGCLIMVSTTTKPHLRVVNCPKRAVGPGVFVPFPVPFLANGGTFVQVQTRILLHVIAVV